MAIIVVVVVNGVSNSTASVLIRSHLGHARTEQSLTLNKQAHPRTDPRPAIKARNIPQAGGVMTESSGSLERPR